MPVTEPFIGREEELLSLRAAYEEVFEEGRSEVVLVTGETGQGKTRLIQEYLRQEWHREKPSLVLEAGCFSRSEDQEPYFPFKEMLARMSDLDDERPWYASLKKQFLVKGVEGLMIHAPDLIGTFVPGSKLIQILSRFALQDTGILEALKKKVSGGGNPLKSLNEAKIAIQLEGFLLAAARQQPLQVVIDDVQWMDAASLGLLQKILRERHPAPILFILIYRSSGLDQAAQGGRHPLHRVINKVQSVFRCQALDLDRLVAERKEEVSRGFVERLAPGVDEEFIREFHERTDGHPLYCSELLMMLKESGVLTRSPTGRWHAEKIARSQMPTAMGGVIRERIDRLPAEQRKWLEMAAVQGEQFVLAVVARAAGLSEEDLLYDVAKVLAKQQRLVEEVDVVFVRASVWIRYRFTHRLIREFLYEELSKGERLYMHLHTAEALEELYEGYEREIPFELGYHYDRALQHERAYEHYLEASQNAYLLGAYESSIDILKKILDRLPFFSPDSDPMKKEMNVLMRLAGAYIAARGYGTPEIEEIHSRIEALRSEVGSDERMFALLWMRWAFVVMQPDLDQAQWLARRLVSLADRSGSDAVIQVEAFHSAGVTAFNMGQFAEAIEAFEASWSHYDPGNAARHIAEFGNDPGILVSCWLTWSYLFVGEVETSATLKERVEASLSECEHLSTRSFAQVFLAMWHLYRDEPEPVLDLAERTLREVEDELPFWKCWAAILDKWARYRLFGEYRSPRQEIERFIDRGGGVWRGFLWALWAEMCETSDEALAHELLEEARASIERSGPMYHTLPILLRVIRHRRRRGETEASEETAATARRIGVEQGAQFWLEELEASSPAREGSG